MKQIEPSLRQDQAIDPNRLDIELKGARWVLRLTVLALSSFLVWAYAFEIDQVVRAPGVIMPSSKVQIIQSKDGGVLLSLPVSAGDEVNKGQVIARFDQTDSLADFEDAKARAASLTANMARLEAEIYERQPVFPNEALDYPKFIKSQLSLFERRQASQAEQLAALREILALVKEEIAMNEPLVTFGDVSRTEILRLRRQEAELSAEITNLINSYFKDAQAEFNKTEEELESVKQELLQRARDLRQNTLKSPMRGIVKNIRVTTTGGVIRPGEEVMEIVPIEEDFVIEAKLSPADVGFVYLGQKATVKVDAFDFTIYGDLDGEIVYISADTLEEGKQKGQEPFYKINVRTKGRSFSGIPDRDLQILPGMTTMVEIKTGANTILNYLLKPISKTMSESLGER
ncbi:MAG: HlyD family type I secretion periplasmic adaptor subunit [Alphaproteobacteria bacterium]|nr:HlyD family type I secretion periplasmic adaptor subunit [Alphaproteobacteria bacterium]